MELESDHRQTKTDLPVLKFRTEKAIRPFLFFVFKGFSGLHRIPRRAFWRWRVCQNTLPIGSCSFRSFSAAVFRSKYIPAQTFLNRDPLRLRLFMVCQNMTVVQLTWVPWKPRLILRKSIQVSSRKECRARWKTSSSPKTCNYLLLRRIQKRIRFFRLRASWSTSFWCCYCILIKHK